MSGDLGLLFNLIFLAIAIAVFLKLRSVLGRRTGHERPPFDPFTADQSKRVAPDRTGETGSDKVVPLPRQNTPGGPDADTSQTDTSQTGNRWAGLAPAGSPLSTGLDSVAAADPNFDPDAFLSGARLAHEMIVTAFAEGDRKGLEPLLNQDVYAGFERAISDREAAGHKIDQTLIGLTEVRLLDAKLEGRIALLTVKFVSELTSCTTDKDGVAVSGDPVNVRKVTDIWSFERDLSSRDPNWRLAATESAN